MKILILGGTTFVGRTLVELGLQRGHEVTLFNRGMTNSDLFPEVEKIRGDRKVDMSPPVRRSAQFLREAADHYTFISTIFAYKDFSRAGVSEADAVEGIVPEEEMEITGIDLLGRLKAGCEAMATEAFPDRALLIRPGWIVGPHDTGGRFMWWCQRVMRGGELLAPGGPDAPVQIIDVRDLSIFILEMIERRAVGAYNTTGPQMTFSDLLTACQAATGSEIKPVWVSGQYLLERGVTPMIEMPLWWDPAHDNFLRVGSSKARAEGLYCRPLEQMARATLAWYETVAKTYPWKVGMSPEREAELPDGWRALT